MKHTRAEKVTQEGLMMLGGDRGNEKVARDNCSSGVYLKGEGPKGINHSSI